MDAVADAVGGKTGTMLLGKVKQGGGICECAWASGRGGASSDDYSQAGDVQAGSSAACRAGQGCGERELKIPIDRIIAMEDGGAGQAAAEKGGLGRYPNRLRAGAACERRPARKKRPTLRSERWGVLPPGV